MGIKEKRLTVKWLTTKVGGSVEGGVSYFLTLVPIYSLYQKQLKGNLDRLSAVQMIQLSYIPFFFKNSLKFSYHFL